MRPAAATALVSSPSRLLVFSYLGAVELIALELLSVWLIMPFPGSQRIRSVSVANAVHRTRWAWRARSGALLLAGTPALAFHRPDSATRFALEDGALATATAR